MKLFIYVLLYWLVTFKVSNAQLAEINNKNGEYGHYYLGKEYSIGDVKYNPYKPKDGETDKGMSICYPHSKDNTKTSNGATFKHDMYTISHRTFPLLSVVEIKSMETNFKVKAVITERGPFNYSSKTITEVSSKIAEDLRLRGCGGRVKITYLEKESESLKKQDIALIGSEVKDSNRTSEEEKSVYLGKTRFAEHFKPKSLYIQIGAYEDVENAFRVYKDFVRIDHKVNAFRALLGEGNEVFIRYEGEIHVVRIGPVNSGFVTANKIVEKLTEESYTDAMVIAL